MFLFTKHAEQVTPEEALPGREQAMQVPDRHEVLGTPLQPPFPDGLEQLVVGMGCFWGAERVFWQADGVYTTAVGYAGGYTPNPTYEEVCSGRTGHTEAVLVVFDPAVIALDGVLRLFWENHDPTQGNRQGNDVGTQYRSSIYWANDAQREAAEASRDMYQTELSREGTARSRPRSRRRGRSTTRSRTTSSTSPRTRTATAGSGAPASPVRSAYRQPSPPRASCSSRRRSRRSRGSGRGSARPRFSRRR